MLLLLPPTVLLILRFRLLLLQNLNYYLLETMHQLIMVQPLLRRNVVLPRLQAPSGPVPIGHKKEAKWTQYMSITPNQVSDWT